MKTKEQATSWIREQVGKRIDWDGWYGAQCVDLILAYMHFLGYKAPTGNAKDWTYLPLPKGFVRTKNTPSYKPQAGEIVVWGDGSKYGHIGLVAEDSDGRSFVSLEQNVEGDLEKGGPARVQYHTDWENLWFIRPPFLQAPKTAHKTNPPEFIRALTPAAIEAWEDYKILPSLTIAQAALESGWGTSELAQKANALFGIKVHSGWTGKSYTIETWEEAGFGDSYLITAKFRAYDSWGESVKDRSKYLTGGNRYKDVIGETDYRKACRAIQRAGYATAGNYADTLIGIIEYNKLDEIDKIALAKDLAGNHELYPEPVQRAMDALIKAIKEEYK